MASIKIVEVSPRDGLQNEVAQLSVQIKFNLIQRLAACGVKYLEAGAFVSEKRVPQMANSHKVVERINKSATLKKKISYSVLTPNLYSLRQAISCKVKEISVFASCTESFSQRNIGASIHESFNEYRKVVVLAKKNNMKTRGYLSMAFGCPYSGKVSPRQTVSLVEKMLALGVYEISLGDTIGVATPLQVKNVLNLISKIMPLKKVALHMHNTRGVALPNVLRGLDMGIHTIDSSLGGMGGCPYAKGASGNLATEELVYMLEGMGVKTGLDLKKLIQTRTWIERHLGRKLPSQMKLPMKSIGWI